LSFHFILIFRSNPQQVSSVLSYLNNLAAKTRLSGSYFVSLSLRTSFEELSFGLFLRSTMMYNQSENSYIVFLRQDETLAGGPEVRKLLVTEIPDVT